MDKKMKLMQEKMDMILKRLDAIQVDDVEAEPKKKDKKKASEKED